MTVVRLARAWLALLRGEDPPGVDDVDVPVTEAERRWQAQAADARVQARMNRDWLERTLVYRGKGVNLDDPVDG